MHVLKTPWSGSPSGIVTTVKVGGNIASLAVTAHTPAHSQVDLLAWALSERRILRLRTPPPSVPPPDRPYNPVGLAFSENSSYWGDGLARGKRGRGGGQRRRDGTHAVPRTRKQAPLGEEPAALLSNNCRDDRIRTCDPLGTSICLRLAAGPVTTVAPAVRINIGTELALTRGPEDF